MTPERMNVVIAELCGWIQDYFDKDSGERRYFWRNPKNKHDIWATPPNYVGNLNAMHEAEMMLTEDQKYLCYQLLFDPYNTSKRILKTDHWHKILATAPQRAEAFIRIVGKLEE